MSAVRVDLNLTVIRRDGAYGFAIVDAEGNELTTIGEGASPDEIHTWISDYFTATVAPVLAGRFYAAYRAVKTG